jgi:hypothetical protein
VSDDSERSVSKRRHAPKGPLKAHPDLMDARHLMEGAQCSAKSKQSGQRCKRPAIEGGTVCYIHGGAAPHVKEAAMDRLRKLQHPAIDAIHELIEQTQFPSVRYASSKDVLDRTLGRATETLDVKHSQNEEQLVAILDAWKLAHRHNGDDST